MVERKILLNPGPATTTDTVKMAQVVPDICPREKEFGAIMKKLSDDLVRVVHGDLNKYAAVLFCGSGTLNMDVCLNSLLPDHKKILIINNGAYSSRGVEICQAYRLPYIELKFAVDQQPDLLEIEKILSKNHDIGVVYTTHHETGSGLLNPIKDIGKIVHRYQGTFIVDTTSTYAMLPIDIEDMEIDFCMASAQKGLMSMTGLSFVVGRRDLIEESKSYPVRSYYCNLYMQYAAFQETGQMHFTPPVQTIYATVQAMKEYWAEGEIEKWNRHKRTFKALKRGVEEMGFRCLLPENIQAGLVVSVVYPDNPEWDFEKIHNYCYAKGYTIYPGKVGISRTFRLCSLGAINECDAANFLIVLHDALKECGMQGRLFYK